MLSLLHSPWQLSAEPRAHTNWYILLCLQVPVIGFIGRLDYQKGADLVLGAAHWLLNQDVQIICLGTGDKHLEVQPAMPVNTWLYTTCSAWHVMLT